MNDLLSQLNRQLAYAKANSPFYAYLPERVTSLAALKQIPPISAQDLITHGRRMLCCSPNQVRRMVTLQTSGTTAAPKRLAFTDQDLQKTVDFFRWGMSQLCGPGRTVGIFLPGHQPDGLCDLLSRGIRGFGGIPRVYGLIQDYRNAAEFCRRETPQILVGIPSQIRRLALYAPQLRIPRVLLSADYVSPAVKTTVEQVWGCQVYEHYGLTESGLGCAVETPLGQGMRCREDILLEVEQGQILLTTLQREALPLIRYQTGDLGELLPNGNLKNVLGRAAHRGQHPCITQLDDVLYRINTVLDFQACWESDVLTLRVLGDIHAAKVAMKAAFPGIPVAVVPAAPEQLLYGGKRRIHAN